MKVLMLVDHLRENGGLRVVHDIAVRLQSDAARATLFVLQGTLQGAQLTPASDLPVVYGVRRRLALRWAIPRGFWPLLMQTRRCDVVVSGSEVGYTLILGWLTARVAGKPFIILVQSPLGEAIEAWVPVPLRFLTRRANARADASLCVSSGLIEGVVENGLPRDRVFTVSVGVDAEQILSLAGQSSSVVQPSGRYIVAAGRLDAQKGFDVLIRAHAAVLRSGGAPHDLIIVGEGHGRAALTELAAELDVAGSVLLPGFVENLHPLVAGADLFVLSSRREGMGGLVLLEALAHATPIIATDCASGPRELLGDGQFGELVPVDDPQMLANAILRHLTDPTELRRRAAGGPARVQDFDPAKAALLFSDVLRTVADQRAARTKARIRAT